MKKHIWKWVLLLVAVVMSASVSKATDVENNNELRDALSRADSYIKLTKNIEISDTDNPFVLSEGNVNLDLNGYTITNGKFWGINYVTLIFRIEGGELTISGAGSIIGGSRSADAIEIKGGILNINTTVIAEEKKAIYINGENARLKILGGANIYSEHDRDPSIYLSKGNGSISFEGGSVDHKGGGKSIQIDGGSLSEIITPNNYKLYQNGKRVDLTQSSISGNVGVTRVYNILNDYDSSKGTVSVKVDDVETTWAVPGETVTVEATPNNGYKVNDYEDSFIMPSNDKTLNFEFSLIQYNIWYQNIDGAINNNPDSYNVETGTIPLQDPIKEGFKFMGWTYNGEPITSIPEKTTGDLTLVASWSKIYKISYNVNGGIMPDEYILEFTEEEQNRALPLPTKEGFIFKGWLYKGTAITFIPEGTAEDMELVAKWSKKYSISYDVNGGVMPDEYKSDFTDEDEYFELPRPTWKYYEFNAWKDKDGNIWENIDPAKYKDDDVLYLTAEWKAKEYILSFRTNQTDISVADQKISIENKQKLPELIKNGLTFMGWFNNAEFQGDPLTNESILLPEDENSTTPIVIYAQWAFKVYTLTFETNGGTAVAPITFSIDTDGRNLPSPSKSGYTFVGWYKEKDFSGEPIKTISKGTSGDFKVYAKWTPKVYSIEYDYLYNGTLPSDAPKSYTIEDETFSLPIPTRPNFSFVGWHTMESTYWGEDTGDMDAVDIKQGSIGNKTFYAEWKGGRSVIIRQPEGGKITVKLGNEEIASETIVDPGKKLTVSVAATSSAFKFKQLWVNGEMYETQPIDVTMPDTCGITISALMDDGRPQASAPSMSVSPENVSALPAGGSAEVTLYGGESGGKLYYRIGGIEKEYTGKFLVTSSKEGVVVVEGISRKEGYKDGVTTREITFGTGNISITFDLPEGITAVNPDGGEVETAVATGGSFKFKLVVDSKIIETPATAIKVYANGRQLSRGTGNTYVLSELKENVTVTVGNVEYKSFAVKLKQTDGGRIAFVGIAGDSCSVVYGDTIQLEAFPNAGYFFTAWNDNTKQNPRELIVKKAQTVSAKFSKEKMVYMVTFPQIEGVTVKTLSGYSQQVDKNGTCKFWLDIDAQYKSSEPVVKVNGEVIEPTETGVYSLYYIREHKSVSVEGITRDKITLSQKTNTSITNVETGKDATKEGLYAGDMVTLYAKAPAGKMFSKWNDGVTENPRMMTASDAQGVQPLFVSASGETESLSFTLPAGAGVVSLSGNLNAVEKGGIARFKIVLLPQYAGSKIVVKAAEKVLQQEMELRASTEAETYVYSLNNISENTTVTVEGLTLGSYTLTLEQTENGKVEADKTGEQLYGTVVNLTATPEAEYMFLRWSDGNTLNPYPYTITKNVTLKAEFLEADKMVVDNEEIAAQDARIYTANGSLYVELSQPSDLKVWNFSGAMLINRDIAPGLSSYPLPAGDYLVRVGNNKVVKVMVK